MLSATKSSIVTFKEVFNIMKKRLLITSIVMMLVVAVALSTATYAWFTSNASVTANTVHMTAAVSDLESISIAWLGSEQKAGTLTAADGDALQPMVPTALTGTTAATVEFTGASIGLNGNFDAVGTPQTPYTWKSSDETPVTAFYINNDSTTTALDVTVSVANISYYNATPNAEIQPLAAGTLLQAGQIYYKKVVSGNNVTWTRLTATDAESWENNTYIADSTTATGDSGDYIVYGTKGIEDYVRVAIFATTEYTSTSEKPDTVVPANYSYKGILTNGSTDPIGYGTITSGMSPSVLTTPVENTHPAITNGQPVSVVTNLSPLARVYVIVKVWIDGTYFTGHESGESANVSLTFNAARHTA